MKLFKDAYIYDGTGADAFNGDVLVENDKIVKVDKCIEPEDGWEVIDLKGLSIAPGFIDAHSHNDWFAIKSDPQKYFEPFIRQGITSFVTGNCGLSAVGFESDSQYADKVGGGLFSFTDTTGVYPRVSDFFDAVADSKTAISMNEVSKVLGIKGYGRNNLFEFLRDKGVLDKYNVPYQRFVDRGYFRVIEQSYMQNGERQITTKTLVYQKGVDAIRKLLLKEIGE